MTVVPMHPSPERSLAEGCRTFMSGFPTGVAVVTSVDGQGGPWGLTCSSLMSVTLEPPTLLVSLRVGSRTLAAIEDRGIFAVNLLHARGQAAAETFAAGAPDRFHRVRWQPRGDDRLPWLVDDACGFAACALTDVRVVGDHALVVGQVTDVQYTADTPLLYGLRQYSMWQSSIVEGSTCAS
ncbi:NADH-FMN oxidoreductase RutF, flavin reductase (DIM6/NTAB) family [Micromonospora phaseoli]|uniref:NADH-FMN oxidoreductase RutF, flavin reductase (DIM6/NTAB) family n=1 Tax=Micromonospora phaseoli TaxID=1144548 RepID=A0A1H7CMX4_9ACTN|nr:flavin reductase family protein [Micromonospora phaseoli]PZV91676.1 flavin reductase (DIM6/NTAB) family NADH-FMN oxidoreductase RutF [Micromonospora phaseoli]GIJ79308.1 oxidoreductase [Micromonospora phaseoli]SEJ90999.1 NADH-FMN oxidoreductase RutF, flavin reductase (DIM6/NTAB) family [Micromonospora phaseoli]